MASERNERNENRRGGGRRESSTNGNSESVPRNQETNVQSLFVLDEILKSTDPIDPN